MPTTSEVNRRHFMATAMGLAAAAATLPKLRAQNGGKSANSTVGYGFIGAGSRGQQLLQHLSRTEVGRPIALCDIYSENLKKGIKTVGGNPEGYYDYKELLARKDIDAVYIAVPLFTHFEITKAALEAGKHVFCEKSLVFTPEEVHQLRALAAKYPNQIIQVGLQRRYSEFYQVARQMIDKGMLGRVTHMQAQWHRNGDWRRPVKDKTLEEQINWRMYRKYSGGLVAELASHQIDIAEWMFGYPPVSVMGVGGIDYWKDGRDIYDNIQLIYTYPKGEKLMYSSITNNAHMPYSGLQGIREVGEVIMGDAGTIQISLGKGMWYREPDAPKVGKAGAAKENWTAGATVTEAALTKGFPILPGQDVDTRDSDSFIAKEVKFAKRWLYNKGILVPEEVRDPVGIELEDFLLCVRDGKKPKANLDVGLNDSIGVILANLAMDQERKVKFSEIETMGKGEKTPAKKRG
ncbi:MAG: Gfo/Idh/MocA family oxidoreductase [Acidobacteria bacterium]|nr:Gfo/Idh/MocA family oxidoreductase [Acidobacteriota bacterium]